MKAVKIILSIFLIFLIVVLGVSVFLGPDHLRFCSQPSDGAKTVFNDCTRADAIVVISGGDTAARTAEAVKLYQAGYAPFMLFSGAAADKSGPSNAKTMQRQAVDAGVPGTATIIEEESSTTDQNAELSMTLLKRRGVKSIILVTSAYHQRRAQLQFEHYSPMAQGGKISVRSHPVAEDKDWNRFWWLSPWGWGLAISELTKMVVVVTGGVDRV